MALYEQIWKKAVVGLIIVPLMVVIIYLGGWWLLLPVCAMALVGLGEYYSATFKKGYRPVALLGYVIGVLILFVTEMARNDIREGAILGLIIFLVGLAIMSQFANREGQTAVGNSAVTTFGVIYIPLMLSFMLRLRQFNLPEALGNDEMNIFWQNAGAVLLVIVPVWLGDSLALAVGGTWGRRKLAPSISPGKTVEGALAGMGASIIGALVIGVSLGMAWYHAFILGFLIAVSGQLGDLGKSVLKRDLGVKDFGHMFGPHGGVLDRFDAVMFAQPLAYLYLWLFFIPHGL